jgi:hypothetical protein
MLRHFDKLEQTEKDLLLDAPALITILVAGADGQMDSEEEAWAAKLAVIRSFDYNTKLNDYYKQVKEIFSKRLQMYNSALPKERDARLAMVSDQLTEVNRILHKMDDLDAVLLYNDFKSFARHIAKASGGIMRWMAIGPSEAQVIELPMLDEFK